MQDKGKQKKYQRSKILEYHKKWLMVFICLKNRFGAYWDTYSRLILGQRRSRRNVRNRQIKEMFQEFIFLGS